MWRGLRFWLGALALVSGLALTGTATAAAPVLLSVGHVDRHPMATWSLPAGVESRVIEVATSLAVDSDGAFLPENVATWDNLESEQTSWTSPDQVDPGTYYVHVSGFHLACGPCPLREYSNVVTLVVDGSGGGVSPPPVGTLPPPTGLVLDSRTESSISFSWVAPAGVAVDRFLVFRDGVQIAELPGATASFADTGLAPASEFRYTVVAGAGAELTVPSAELVVRTLAPPLSAARLAGRYTVTMRVVAESGFDDVRRGQRSTETWTFTGSRVRGESPGGSWRMTLRRAGSTYSGRSTARLWGCFFTPVSSTLTLSLRATAAGTIGGAWRVTRFTGRFTDSAPGKTSGIFRCPAARYTAAVTGRAAP